MGQLLLRPLRQACASTLKNSGEKQHPFLRFRSQPPPPTEQKIALAVKNLKNDETGSIVNLLQNYSKPSVKQPCSFRHGYSERSGKKRARHKIGKMQLISRCSKEATLLSAVTTVVYDYCQQRSKNQRQLSRTHSKQLKPIKEPSRLQNRKGMSGPSFAIHQIYSLAKISSATAF